MPVAAAIGSAFLTMGCGEDGPAAPAHQHRAAQISLNQTSLTMQEGAQVQLSVTGQCSCGEVVQVGPVWESSNLSVATVSPAGVVTAVGPGSAMVTARAVGLRVSAGVTVPGYLLSVGYGPGLLMATTHTHFTIHITRIADFTGSVSLAAQGVPPGLTLSFSPMTTTGNVVEATVFAGEEAASGKHQFTIVGSADGLANRQLQVSATVESPVGEEFALIPDPETITVVRGVSATATIALMLTAGYDVGWIELRVLSALTGMAWGFSPAGCTQSTTSVLTVEVAATGVPGTYDVFIGGVPDVWGPGALTHIHVMVIDPQSAPDR